VIPGIDAIVRGGAIGQQKGSQMAMQFRVAVEIAPKSLKLGLSSLTRRIWR